MPDRDTHKVFKSITDNLLRCIENVKWRRIWKTNIVKMGWSTAVIIGVVIYMVLVAVLADIADRLMP